jgi:hypothetical protein
LVYVPELFLTHRRFIREHAVHFTHGDLYPTNIMIRAVARRPVVIFDWELAHLNLPTFDASMVYLHAWRRPVWQKSFKALVLSSLKNTPAAKLAWQITTVSLATRMAGFCYIRLHNLQPMRYPRLPARQRSELTNLYHYYLRELRRALVE